MPTVGLARYDKDTTVYQKQPLPNLLVQYRHSLDIAGSVPDHYNKENIAIKSVTKYFGFHCSLLSMQ